MNTLPMLGQSKDAALKAFYKMRVSQLKGQQLERTEAQQADRAKRLAELFEMDVWNEDILPILTKLYDDCLDAVKNKTLDPDALKALDDFIVRLGGALTLGIGAMQRIAKRRLEASEKLAEMNEGQS